MVRHILDTNWDLRSEITTLGIPKIYTVWFEEGFGCLLCCRVFFGTETAITYFVNLSNDNKTIRVIVFFSSGSNPDMKSRVSISQGSLTVIRIMSPDSRDVMYFAIWYSVHDLT